MASSQNTSILLLFTLLVWPFLLACGTPLVSEPVVQAGTEVEAAGAAEKGAVPEAEAEAEEVDVERESKTTSVAGCADGVVKDDGSVETGYGFVPQATAGIYVQEFHADEFSTRSLEKICVCWLKTKYARDIQFEVVFYEAAGNVPATEPYARVPAVATGLPDAVKTAGAFYEVDVAGVEIPQGTSYIGVHWNPSLAKYLFLCTDTSEETAKVNVFFREDLAPAWASVFASRDPIFRDHRSVLLRARAGRGVSEDASSREAHRRR